jgi:cell division ATPase FtsA
MNDTSCVITDHMPENSPAAAFKAVTRRGISGVFSTRSGDITRSIMLKDGRPVFASSTDREERLNGFLLRGGFITLTDLVRGMERMLRENRRLGAVLVEEGLLDKPSLMKALRTQVGEIACSALTAADGSSVFKEQPVSDNVDVGFVTPVNTLIHEALFGVDALHRILDEIGGPSAVYGLTERAEDEVGTIRLGQDEMDVLATFEPHASLEQTCSASQLSDFDTCRLIWVMLTVGALELFE